MPARPRFIADYRGYARPALHPDKVEALKDIVTPQKAAKKSQTPKPRQTRVTGDPMAVATTLEKMAFRLSDPAFRGYFRG